MKKGAVHLTETSYPIGGNNTNTVIAAHRGYARAEMFKNLNQLEIGDKVYIKNFKEDLSYEVYDIKIISSNNIDVLKIEEGKEILTLLTCYTLGYEKQRLCIKAKRI